MRDAACAALALALCVGCRSTSTAPKPDPASLPPSGAPAARSAAVVTSQASCPSGMALVRGGHFSMGPELGGDPAQDPLALPARDVTVATFCMDVTEVSETQMRLCKSCGPPPPLHGCTLGLTDLPARCLTHAQAVSYCAEEKKRLPTEEEWEYAARGQEGRVYPWGSRWPVASLCVGRTEPGSGGPCPVGTSTDDRTPDGILDLAGNAQEWTSTRVCDGRSKPCADGYVVRGNDFADPGAKGVVDVRGVFDDRAYGFGFRCVSTP